MTVLLKIGRRAPIVCKDLADAKATHNRIRDEEDAGSRDWPLCTIQNGEFETLTISYNGRIWDVANPKKIVPGVTREIKV